MKINSTQHHLTCQTLKRGIILVFTGLVLAFLTGIPDPVYGQTTVTIGSGSGSQIQVYPLGNKYGYEYSAAIYTNTEIGVSGVITSVAWKARTYGDNQRPIVIYLKEAANSELTQDTWQNTIAGATKVYDGSIAVSEGWNIVELTQPFSYSGISNLQVMVEANYGFSGATSSDIEYSLKLNSHEFWYQNYTPPAGLGTVHIARPDIQLTLLPLSSCSGKPNAGIFGMDTLMVCANKPFAATVQGSTLGAGISGQWQKKTGGGAWMDIAGEHNISLNVPSGINTETQYRYYAVCSNSGLSDTTESLSAAFKPLDSCYCSVINNYGDGCKYGDFIKHFVLAGESNSIISDSNNVCPQNLFFRDKTVLAPAYLQAGSSYSAIVTPGGTNDNVSIWIDWNDNAVFEPGEKVATSTAALSSTGSPVSVSIPVSASPGKHRMRVILKYGQASNDPCNTGSMGEGHDYTVYIIGSTPCSGTPEAVTVTPKDSVVCAGQPVVIYPGDNHLISGLSFQWQRQTGGGAWTDIPGSTNFILNLTGGINEETNFRLVVKCVSSNLFVTGSAVTVKTDFKLCYCIPVSKIGCYDGDFISQFYLNGENNTAISDFGNTCSYRGESYKDKTSMPAVDLYSGINYTASIATESTGDYAAVWIDFNDNGTFEPGEKVGASSTKISTTSATLTINVPASANAGKHRMRVVVAYDEVPSDPCNLPDYGNAHDYSVNIIPVVPCSGAPDLGIVIPSTPTVCGSKPFSLYLKGGVLNAGVTYQWQQQTGNGAWIDVAGGNTTSLNVSGITQDTKYRIYAVCTGSNLSDTTDPVTIRNICYCVPTTTMGCNYDMGDYYPEYIDDFVMKGENNTAIKDIATGYSISTTCTYQDRTSFKPVDLSPGMLYNASVLTGENSLYNYISMWIDFNDDGTFSPAEYVNTQPFAYSNGYLYDEDYMPIDITVYIPNGVPAGLHRMRMAISADTLPVSSCNLGSLGEAHDYLVNILSATACSGQPAAGTIDTASFAICAKTEFYLKAGDYTLGSGIVYQWQEKAGTGPWTDIPGAITPYLYKGDGINSNTSYRFKVTCSNGNMTGISEAISVTVKPFTECYCIPDGWGSHTVTITNFTLENLNHNPKGWGYHDNTGTAPAANLNAGADYVVSMTTGPNPSGSASLYSAAVFIDYNDDAEFDVSEKVSFIPNGVTGNTTVQFPAFTVKSIGGQHRLRVKYGFSNADNLCYLGEVGAAEDYLVNILGVTPVRMSALRGVLTSDSRALLKWDTYSEDNNKGFEVQRSENGTDFRSIGFVASQAGGGNSASKISYHFLDEQLVNQSSFYRLIQKDRDGKSSYSNIIRVNAPMKSLFLTAYPNPVRKGFVKVEVLGKKSGYGHITLTSMTGAVLRELKFTGNYVQIDMDQLAAGLYVVKYSDEEGTAVLKLVKE